jgi:hypothetical protein
LVHGGESEDAGMLKSLRTWRELQADSCDGCLGMRDAGWRAAAVREPALLRALPLGGRV